MLKLLVRTNIYSRIQHGTVLHAMFILVQIQNNTKSHAECKLIALCAIISVVQSHKRIHQENIKFSSRFIYFKG